MILRGETGHRHRHVVTVPANPVFRLLNRLGINQFLQRNSPFGKYPDTDGILTPRLHPDDLAVYLPDYGLTVQSDHIVVLL